MPNPVHGNRETARFYDRDSTRYDQDRWATSSGQRNLRAQSLIINEFLGKRRGGRILEVGVGTGRIASDIAREDLSIVGVDSSAGMLKACRDKLRLLRRKEISLVQGDGLSLPFADQSFDSCVSINVFSHLEDHKKVFSEVSRVLKDEGFFVVNFPNLYSLYLPAALVVNLKKRSIKKDVFTRWYKPRRFRKAAESSGFKLKRVAGQVHVPGSIDTRATAGLLFAADKLLRFSALRWACPTVFFLLQRASRG
jgi:ubiquinone/menaquinone biosynthesis C-methylase UbiE